MENNMAEKETGNVSFISKSEQFIEKYKTVLIVCAVAIVVVIAAIFGVKKFISEPRQAKAEDAIFAAEQWFAQGDFESALNGDEQNSGFLRVIDQYGSTKAGKRAKYEAGVCYLRLGKFAEAAQYLGDYKGKDHMTPILNEMCLGDAEVEQGNHEAAIKHYNKAAKMDDNQITTPFALYKAGVVYMTMLGDKENAIKCFQNVKDNYPEWPLWSEMDRYITYAENL